MKVSGAHCRKAWDWTWQLVDYTTRISQIAAILLPSGRASSIAVLVREGSMASLVVQDFTSHCLGELFQEGALTSSVEVLEVLTNELTFILFVSNIGGFSIRYSQVLEQVSGFSWIAGLYGRTLLSKSTKEGLGNGLDLGFASALTLTPGRLRLVGITGISAGVYPFVTGLLSQLSKEGSSPSEES